MAVGVGLDHGNGLGFGGQGLCQLVVVAQCLKIDNRSGGSGHGATCFSNRVAKSSNQILRRSKESELPAKYRQCCHRQPACRRSQ